MCTGNMLHNGVSDIISRIDSAPTNYVYDHEFLTCWMFASFAAIDGPPDILD